VVKINKLGELLREIKGLNVAYEDLMRLAGSFNGSQSFTSKEMELLMIMKKYPRLTDLLIRLDKEDKIHSLINLLK